MTTLKQQFPGVPGEYTPQSRATLGPGRILHLTIAIVAGGSVLAWIFEVARHLRARRDAKIYTHWSFYENAHGGPHLCSPSHWRVEDGWVRVEHLTTDLGEYTVVKHALNRRYYALGKVLFSATEPGCFESIYAALEGGLFAYYVFLVDQGVDGFPTAPEACLFIASQQDRPSPPPVVGSNKDYFLPE
jgi:hypothetical protein